MPPLSRAVTGKSGSAGFVLVPVIWVVFLLGLAAASYNLTVRSGVGLTSASAARTEAAALADVGINLALYDISNAATVRSWQRRIALDGRGIRCSAGAGHVSIVIRDESGKVDLNAAREPLLVALVAGIGVPHEQAVRLAAAIVDYRDPDDIRVPEGAERGQYLEAGRLTGPKNAAFDTPQELAQVLGFDTAIVEMLLPHVTVHSGLPGIDPAKASPELLQVLSRGRGASRSVISTHSGLPADMVAASSQRVFAIVAQAAGERGGKFARKTIVRIGSSGPIPFVVLSTQQVGFGPTLETTDAGAC